LPVRNAGVARSASGVSAYSARSLAEDMVVEEDEKNALKKSSFRNFVPFVVWKLHRVFLYMPSKALLSALDT